MSKYQPLEEYSERHIALTASYAFNAMNRDWFDGLFPDKGENRYIPPLVFHAYEVAPRGRRKGRFLNMGEATRAMRVSNGRTAQRYIDRAVEAGLFEKASSPIDGREVLLKPTQKLFKICDRELDYQGAILQHFMTCLILAGPLPDNGKPRFKLRAKNPKDIAALEELYQRLVDHKFVYPRLAPQFKRFSP